MEYLVVHFPTKRRVKIDGEFNGHTGDLIEIEGGPHTVTLEPPPNFQPPEHPVDLRNTSALTPVTVTFTVR